MKQIEIYYIYFSSINYQEENFKSNFVPYIKWVLNLGIAVGEWNDNKSNRDQEGKILKTQVYP